MSQSTPEKTVKTESEIAEEINSETITHVNSEANDDISIMQKVGMGFLFATFAWSIYVNIVAFGVFLVMLADMAAGACSSATAAKLANVFVLGFLAIPLFVVGLILRKGARGSALRWGVIGLLASLFSGFFWYILVMIAAVFT